MIVRKDAILIAHEIEKEFKNLLNKEEYEYLIAKFNLEDVEPIQQTNIYYDTTNGQLRSLNMGLRIRLYEESGEQTLKSPLQENEKLETTDALTLEEATNLSDIGKLKKGGHVAKKLEEAGVKLEDLQTIARLSTVPHTFPGTNGNYFLDESFYQDQKDYELEFETDDLEKGLIEFEKFLVEHKIKPRFAAQKVERAMNYPNS